MAQFVRPPLTARVRYRRGPGESQRSLRRGATINGAMPPPCPHADVRCMLQRNGSKTPGGFRFLSPRRKEQRDGCEQYGNVHKKTRSSGESFPYGRNPLFRRGNRCIDQISPVTSRNTGRSARWVLGLCSESISRPSGVRKSMPWPPWSRKRGGSCRKGPLSDAARPWA